MSSNSVTVIGGGLAGSEAAWQAARLGADVTLYEMRPARRSAAHSGEALAELVCSNSLGSDSAEHPSGNLKQELRELGSVIIQAADRFRVPAGGALAVDRELFSSEVTRLISEDPRIKVIRGEVEDVRDVPWPAVIATGPLTSDPLMSSLEQMLGAGSLYMYDAVAPIVSADSIDFSRVFAASRYGKGEADYINCPMDKEQYLAFRDALVKAERVPLSRAEDMRLFEACMPIEEMADRGVDTIRFGPLKPVGLEDPSTGQMPYAVVQLRTENLPKSSYNLVGFQTRLRWGEQRRVFSMIPGLESASFIRYGVVHRNSYLDSPQLLGEGLMFRSFSGLFAAGQLTGSEGYVESTATGALAGINAARLAMGKAPVEPPAESCLGALASYVRLGKTGRFDPMSISFGLLPDPIGRHRGRKEKRQAQLEAARIAFKGFLQEVGGI